MDVWNWFYTTEYGVFGDDGMARERSPSKLNNE